MTQLSLIPEIRTPAVHEPAGDIDANLEQHAHHARGAFSPNTERALRSDTAVYASWCGWRGLRALPAAAETIAAFVDAMAHIRAPATVQRYVSSIATYHRAAGLESPTESLLVKLALKRMYRQKGRRQKQAHGITLEIRNRLLDATLDTVRGARDKALLAVAYDTMLRRSELVALKVNDLAFADDDSGTVLIRRSKTDTEGEGAYAFLAPDTAGYVSTWLEVAELIDGLLFRSVAKGGRIGEALNPNSVARIFKQMARTAGLSPEVIKDISGHSGRVGCAQDMAAFGIELSAIMQAGRWKTATMVSRYTEKLVARRGGAAKLAALQNRL